MNSLKQINFEFLLNNIEPNKIIKNLSNQKKLDLYSKLCDDKCSYCKKDMDYHAKCFKCRKRKCIIFETDKCLECVRNKKFTILLRNIWNGYHHSISYNDNYYYVDIKGDNIELKNLTYDEVIDYLNKIFK